MLAILSACTNTQSLQQYFVSKSEDPNFLSIDLPVSLLNSDKANLTDAQKSALASLRKLNILAFKRTDANMGDFTMEKQEIADILQEEKFTELMKMTTIYGNATVRYLGDEDAIDEVIIYGDNDEKGFVLARLLGSDMNPAKLISFIQAIEKSDYKGEGLEKLAALLKR